MFETGDDFDDKRNHVDDAAAVSGGNQYFVLHVGGRDGHELHVVEQQFLLAVRKPDETLLVFDGWEANYGSDTQQGRGVAASAWRNLTDEPHRRVRGRPLARLTVEKDPDYTSPANLPRSDSRGGTVRLQDDEVVVTTQGSSVLSVFEPLDGVDVVYEGVDPPSARAEQSRQSSTPDRSTSGPSHERTMPDGAKEAFPALHRVFAADARHSARVFESYLDDNGSQPLVADLVGEVLGVLGYDRTDPDDAASYFDTVATKDDRRIPVKTFVDETIDEFDRELCNARCEEADVTELFVVDADADSPSRTAAWHDCVRAIDGPELQQLVRGAILRLTEPDSE